MCRDIMKYIEHAVPSSAVVQGNLKRTGVIVSRLQPKYGDFVERDFKHYL